MNNLILILNLIDRLTHHTNAFCWLVLDALSGGPVHAKRT